MQNWRTRTFNQGQLADTSISGALADPDQDHYSNLMEYVFNSDPLDSESSPFAPLTIVGRGSDVVVTTFQQNLPADTMCELQIRGDDDQDWITIGANYGHPNPAFRAGWFTNLGRGNQSTLPRDRSAAIYRYAKIAKPHCCPKLSSCPKFLSIRKKIVHAPLYYQKSIRCA